MFYTKIKGTLAGSNGENTVQTLFGQRELGIKRTHPVGAHLLCTYFLTIGVEQTERQAVAGIHRNLIALPDITNTGHLDRLARTIDGTVLIQRDDLIGRRRNKFALLAKRRERERLGISVGRSLHKQMVSFPISPL